MSQKPELYHGIEVATDGCYHLYVSTDENEVNEHFAELRRMLGDEIETYSLGTMEATSVDEALDKIRAGDWDYTQLC